MNLSPTVTVFATHAAELPRASNPAQENSFTQSQVDSEAKSYLQGCFRT